ncbi:class I SAM-dependent methyltransferase [Streptomyces tropicalis]|uniref:Class I SAM-dependent methyltransferase n=1 Tax=Streptomyces tropicalis TaxID=3034234 RepID=A0ABT6A5J5_9ACTN|nr:class I SAM-dependent methyltransferase [Streptomyces tropicalis]MDF3299914.1 class I SAM-dependent methyltransferase [Streptomyces tropicalis]
MPSTTSSVDRPLGAATAPDDGTALDTLLRQLVLATGLLTVLRTGRPDAASLLPTARALSEQGRGRVVACDPDPARRKAAAAAIRQAGLDRYAEVRPGRPERVLPAVPGPVDLLVLDGPPESHLPLLQMLEPRMLPGAVVVACGTHRAVRPCPELLTHLRLPGSGWASLPLPFGTGLELAVCTR